jgi:acyl-CoA dehydrogenase
MASVAAHTATTASNTDSSSSSLFYLRPEVAILKRILDDFVEQECIPAEAEYDAHMATRHGANRWTMDAIPPCMERLKRRAKTLGLWNIFIPPRLLSHLPAAALAQGLGPTIALSYREYGIFCESLGKSPRIAPEACNTSAPDTGNMEVLLEFGSPHQQEQYLLPLLQGSIRSTFLMTEPAVASSDATNLQTKLTVRPRKSSSLRKQTLDEDSVKEYVLTGHKWWSTGAMDPRCRVALVVAKMDYSQQLYYHQQDTNRGGSSSSSRSSNSKCTNELSLHDGAQTIVVIPLPHPNVTIVTEPLTVFGYDDAPHGHAQVILNNVSLSHRDLVGGVGSGFRIAQARLGPGRIHHCMRAIGMAARCYELMLQRTLERRTFGKYLYWPVVDTLPIQILATI